MIAGAIQFNVSSMRPYKSADGIAADLIQGVNAVLLASKDQGWGRRYLLALLPEEGAPDNQHKHRCGA